MGDRATLGREAEALAAAYLRERGLRLRQSNYRCKGGEIDLVMEQGSQLVFVEVRYRSNPRFGSAAESVDRRKQRRLAIAALHYLQRHRLDRPCRFDVVALGGPEVVWLRDAFQPGM